MTTITTNTRTTNRLQAKSGLSARQHGRDPLKQDVRHPRFSHARNNGKDQQDIKTLNRDDCQQDAPEKPVPGKSDLSARLVNVGIPALSISTESDARIGDTGNVEADRSDAIPSSLIVENPRLRVTVFKVYFAILATVVSTSESYPSDVAGKSCLETSDDLCSPQKSVAAHRRATFGMVCPGSAGGIALDEVDDPLYARRGDVALAATSVSFALLRGCHQ